MPIVTVAAWENTLNDEVERTLITEVTDAVARTFGEQIRPVTTVLVQPIALTRWGSGGKPAIDLVS